MKFTHVKKRYYALCRIWDGSNTSEIIELLDRAGCDAHTYDGMLMLRWRDDWRRPSIEMMEVNKSVIRIGENDELKVMTVEEFDAKYEAI